MTKNAIYLKMVPNTKDNGRYRNKDMEKENVFLTTEIIMRDIGVTAFQIYLADIFTIIKRYSRVR